MNDHKNIDDTKQPENQNITLVIGETYEYQRHLGVYLAYVRQYPSLGVVYGNTLQEIEVNAEKLFLEGLKYHYKNMQKLGFGMSDIDTNDLQEINETIEKVFQRTSYSVRQ